MKVEIGLGKPGEIDDAVDGEIGVAPLGSDTRDRSDQALSLLFQVLCHGLTWRARVGAAAPGAEEEMPDARWQSAHHGAIFQGERIRPCAVATTRAL